MKISTNKTVSKFAGRSASQNTVTGLNMWGGVKNNENLRAANNGVSGSKTPDIYACDKSNEQPTRNSNFTAKPNRGAIDYTRGSDKSSNENPKGFKQ